MGFQMCSIDHQLLRLAAFGSQLSQNPIEYAEPAPADEAVIDRLVRTILSWHIAPSQPIAQNENDAAQNQPIE
jgi:hypothetical protein